jgi:hypothetical protein
MKPPKPKKRDRCPLCQAKLVKVNGQLCCTACNIAVKGDTCRFINLQQAKGRLRKLPKK